MINIGIPKIETRDGASILSACVEVDGEVNNLWISVNSRYEKFLCFERSDAFVLGMLHFAMKYGHDIKCLVPMTDRLYEQITDQFLPAFAKINKLSRKKGLGGGWDVRIIAPLAKEIDHPADGVAVGTGCSCGVDSMHVYSAHPEISYACVWNVHGITTDETIEKRRRGWTNLVSQARRFSEAAHVELIIGDSNFDRGCFQKMSFDGSISFGNLFFIYALQKLWSKYYVASGYDITEFRMDCGVGVDPAHYEYLLFSFASIGNLSVRLDGVAQTRIQKVADLLRYPLSRKFLNVCWGINEDGKNCTCYCAKCMRTILELEALGELDRYSQVFDVKYFKAHKEEYLAEWWRGLFNQDDYAIELKPYFSGKKWGWIIRLKASAIFVKKAINKLLRFGATRQGRFEPRG